MNKRESKYFKTAQLMDEALAILLTKKEFELITVKDICLKAGVNRSTFYLHYENTADLLRECIENSNLNFKKYNSLGLQHVDVGTENVNDLIFVNRKYLIPYLEYVKDNVHLFKAVHDYPELFDVERHIDMLFEHIVVPTLERFGVNREKGKYVLRYYATGINSVVLMWAGNGCFEQTDEMIDTPPYN